MPSSALLFVPLVAGFIFLGIFRYTRYLSMSWESTRLILYTGVAGLFLITAAREISDRLGSADANSKAYILSTQVRVLARRLFPSEYSGTMAACVLLSIVVPVILNIYPFTKERSERWTKKFGDRLHVFLTDTVGSGMMVQITLDDSKIYIGYLLEGPTLDPKEKFIVILPFLSGYRDDKRELRITTNYHAFYDALDPKTKKFGELDPGHMRVVLPTERIVSAHLFDEGVFTAIFQGNIPRHDAAQPPKAEQPVTAAVVDLLATGYQCGQTLAPKVAALQAALNAPTPPAPPKT